MFSVSQKKVNAVASLENKMKSLGDGCPYAYECMNIIYTYCCKTEDKVLGYKLLL